MINYWKNQYCVRIKSNHLLETFDFTGIRDKSFLDCVLQHCKNIQIINGRIDISLIEVNDMLLSHPSLQYFHGRTVQVHRQQYVDLTVFNKLLFIAFDLVFKKFFREVT